MKARFWLLSILVLLIINLAWIWRFDQNNKEYSQKMNDNRNRFIQANRELYLMNRGWEFTMKSNDHPLPQGILVQPEKGSVADLNNFIGRSKKLVLVLSDRHCSTCVDQLLFTVKNEIPEVYRNNILILFSVNGPTREQWNHRQKILTGVEFLQIQDKGLKLPMDSLAIPYFFITGPEHLANLAFTPYPSLEVQTKEYLNLIEKRYFN
ncbi:MAG: hypothetical protein NTV01_19395 [Bacteroidia bacterium]|nr:hypothetical protein [Bacteroidia bacterium]